MSKDYEKKNRLGSDYVMKNYGIGLGIATKIDNSPIQYNLAQPRSLLPSVIDVKKIYANSKVSPESKTKYNITTGEVIGPEEFNPTTSTADDFLKSF